MSRRFSLRPLVPAERCEHCYRDVDRVWLVPGDVLDSCRACYAAAMGHEPVHAQGHSRRLSARSPEQARATFHVRLDGRRPA